MNEYPGLYRIVREMLIEEEGLRLKAYRDSKNLWTIGVGHLLGQHISELKITQNVCEAFLKDDVQIALSACEKIFSNFKTFTTARQVALIGMMFQLGESRFRLFKDMLSAIKEGDWNKAAVSALDSKWAKEDSPARAYRMAELLRIGRFI